MKYIFARSLISGAIIALSGNYALAQSQIVPDNTLGAESSTVTPAAPDSTVDEIQGGAIRGANLFHSFREFNVSEGRSAYFLSPNANIQNILARVTGGNPSQILGTLGTGGISSPNLFLINPNGIIFRQNARLNVGGSFVASSASSLKFADQTEFSATEPQTTPLLTMSVPIGLQFGGNVGRIVNQSVAVDSDDNPLGLQVQPGKTLALVGGEVVLEQGGNLTTESGRIDLGSVASPSLVTLNPTTQGWVLGYEGVQNFADIRLSQLAFIYTYPTSGEGGDIQVQGRRVTLSDGSFIADVTSRSSSAGTLTVNASESVELIGSLFMADGSQTPSSLRTDTLGAGAAGNLSINTGKLIVRDGARVSVSTTTGTGSTGPGGTLSVTAASVELSGTSADGQLRSGLFARTGGTGSAGNLKIATGQLIVRDKAQITVDSIGSGNAGNLDVKAGSIRLENGGKLTATSASGEGGNISLSNQDLLLLRGNSEISTNAQGTSNGGNIKINTDLLAATENSNITARAVQGRGGNIRITTLGLFLSPDSTIDASSERGINGIVEINRPDIDPTAELVTLPAQIVDVSGLVASGCSAGGGNLAGRGEFVVTGRGGLPPTPAEATRSDTTLADLGRSIQTEENRASVAIPNNSTPANSAPLVEANGWVTDSKGEVILTANAPNFTSDIPWLKPTSCEGS